MTQAATDRAVSRSYGMTGGYSDAGLGGFLRHALALLQRNAVLVAGIIGLALAIALVSTMLATPRYTAYTSIQIDDQSEQVLGDELGGQTAANSGWDIDRFLNTQLEILRSRALAGRVARKLELASDRAFFEAMGAELPQSGGGAAASGAAAGLVRGGLTVDLPRETRIARLGFSSNDPEVAAKLANAYASEFIQATLQRRFDSSAYARNFVGKQLEEARVRLETSERELNAYAREAGLIRTRDVTSRDDARGTDSVTTASLLQLNEAANKAQAERIEAESRWAAENSTPLLASQAVLASPAVQGLISRQSALRAELGVARGRYLEGHPKVQSLESELAAVTSQLGQAAREVRSGIRADFVAARDAESRLRAQVSRLQGATLAEQDRSVRYNTLAREADTNRSLYDGLLQRFRELNAASGISASNIAVVDAAVAPGAPSSPNLAKNLAIALLIGVVIAGATVFLRDQLDDAIRVPEDVEGKIHLPLLGVVPISTDGEPTAALADAKSPVAEAYNSLRGALLYSTPQGLPPVMLVTSARESEGKSTTSYAIARGVALTGKRVLLVDADLRRPSLHRLLGTDGKRGLSSLLTSSDPAASAIVDTAQEGLALLPAGPIPPSPTELLSAPRMAAVLEELSAAYDMVVIDSSPVLGLADAPVLSAIVDGVLLVIEADAARGGALKSALRRLRAMEPVILGAVLTKFDPAKAGNAYSSYYGYGYYSYQEGEARA
ncbi:MAG: GumC family protein [Novosphingobium sp.]